MTNSKVCPVCNTTFADERQKRCIECGRPRVFDSGNPVLEVLNLTHQYGHGANAILAIENVSLTVNAGEIVLIVGPSGGGKTTALLSMGLLLSPTSGTVAINGTTVIGMSETERAKERLLNIGFVFQQFNLMEALTAKENVALPLLYAGVKKNIAMSRATDILKSFGLKSRLDAKPVELSGGEKQRVSVARALSMGPKVLLADEPTANLDSKAGKAVVKQMIDAARLQGVGVVIVTHDTRLAGVSDRVLVLEDGVLRSGSRVDIAGETWI